MAVKTEREREREIHYWFWLILIPRLLIQFLWNTRYQLDIQWHRNWGSGGSMNRGPPSSWGPWVVGNRNFLGKNLSKIIKIVATRWWILRLKCIKFDFGWGSLQRFPDPLAGFGAALQQGRGWAGEEQGKGREGKWRGGKERGPKLLLNQGPSEPCYATVDIL